MRIVIDLQGAQASSRFRGIGRYSLSLALAIARQRGDHEIILALNGLFPETIEPLRAAFDGVLPQDNIRVWQTPGPLAYFDPMNSDRRRAAELLREAFLASLEPDLVQIMSLFEGLTHDAVASIGRFTSTFPTAVSFYDLIPHIHHDHYLVDRRSRAWYREGLDHLRRASLLLAISESSRQELIAHLAVRPEDIVTVPCAADSRFKPINLDAAAKADLLGRYGIARRFVMYTGGDDPRKNMDGLIRAYARLPTSVRRSYQLAIVCSLESAQQKLLRAIAAEHGMSSDEIVLAGQVSDDDLAKLYNACTLFVFPSWHEGFGLPALEAMSCGAPVIGSNTTSVPEVIGRADALFDPRSDESIGSKLLQALTDNGFRADLARHGLERAKAFSWDTSAQQAIVAFERFQALRHHVPHPQMSKVRRPRLAYVSPWPSERTPIADYNAELLPELSRHYDIEVITSDDRAKPASQHGSIQLRGPDWLRANANSFDRVLYQFGNTPSHGYMFDLLADVPGIVVLHEFFLGGILSECEQKGRRSHVWTRALYESHGYTAVQERFRTNDSGANVFKYPANLEVLQKARGIIVHSECSQRLASQWYGGQVGRDWAVVPQLRAMQPHDPRTCADAYADAIERVHEQCQTDVPALIEAIAAQVYVPNNSECERIASAIARNHPALRSACRLFVDVSQLVQHGAKSGIQRVVRNVLRTLLLEPPAGYRVEPVYATSDRDEYRYARQFTLRFVECPADWAEDDPIDPQIGDIFLGLDLNQHVTTTHARTLDEYRASGLLIYHVIYDLLPVVRPDCFSVETQNLHTRWLNTVTRFDGVVTVSRAVADELQVWLAKHGPERSRPLDIAWWHLGADIEVPASGRGLPSDADKVNETMPWSTWEQSTRKLLDIVVHKRWQATWAGHRDEAAN